MKMKPIIETSWDLQNEAKNDSSMGPMVGIGNQWCCAC